jgi:hypothetical protein
MQRGSERLATLVQQCSLDLKTALSPYRLSQFPEAARHSIDVSFDRY